MICQLRIGNISYFECPSAVSPALGVSSTLWAQIEFVFNLDKNEATSPGLTNWNQRIPTLRGSGSTQDAALCGDIRKLAQNVIRCSRKESRRPYWSKWCVGFQKTALFSIITIMFMCFPAGSVRVHVCETAGKGLGKVRREECIDRSGRSKEYWV